MTTKEPRAFIEACTHCPVCGSAEYRLETRIRSCSACGFTDFNNVIVAVAVWVLNERGELLLIERAKDPGRGRLAPPGGFVDAGENLETAAIREVREETGVEIAALSYVSSAPNTYAYHGLTRPVCDVFFLARLTRVEVSIATAEVTGWRFVSLGDLCPDELAFASMRESLHILKSPCGEGLRISRGLRWLRREVDSSRGVPAAR